jgi:hypothetical protein
MAEGRLLRAPVTAAAQHGVLRLQEDDGKLHSDVLILLPASIAVSDSESMAQGNG